MADDGVVLKKLALTLVAIVLLGGVVFAAVAYRPAIAEVAPPIAASFPAAMIAQGEVLASAGYCGECHTAKGGKPLAGGYPMATQFGTIYSTNITPDAETGIGRWSEAAFRRAMHEGVRRDGAHLFPAFPYDHFTKLTDADISALYAYFMTRPAVHAEAKTNDLPFLLNVRALQAGWKLLFFSPGRYVPKPDRSAAWNRGAYLAEGVSHCGACHTPRGALGAELPDKRFAGAPIDGWIAPPLDRSNPSPLAWDHEELIAYLGTGVSRFHGTAAGPMAAVPRGLVRLPAVDLDAIATYFVSLNGSAGLATQQPAILAKALVRDSVGTGLQYDPAARLYTAACASCHYNSGGAVNPLRPDLALNSAVRLDDPTNLIRVILYGIDARDGAPGVVMPGFASGFSNADVARIAAYLRATRTDHPAWPDLEKTVATIRAQGKGQG